jgi:hypothetical protein
MNRTPREVQLPNIQCGFAATEVEPVKHANKREQERKNFYLVPLFLISRQLA